VLWSIAEQPRPLASIRMPGLQVVDAAWSTDGRRLMLNGRRGASHAVTLWDLTDPARPNQLSLPGFDVPGIAAAALSPDGRRLAVGDGGTSESVALWDIADPARPQRLDQRVASHPAVVRRLAFSPGGQVLATASNDETVALWRVADGVRLAVLDGHEQAVDQIAFTPDATMLAALDHSGVITLWDVAEPSPPVRLHTIARTNSPAMSFALTADGRRLIVGRDDGELEAWDIGRIRDIVNDPARAACALTGRGLTTQEWSGYVPERPFRPTC
jgi:WD40 repeat protein